MRPYKATVGEDNIEFRHRRSSSGESVGLLISNG